MRRLFWPQLLLLITPFFTSCGKYIDTNQTHYLKDGEEVPTVNLAYYRSVQERPGQDSSLSVALAISGGGSRAANFGIGVMLGLEELSLEYGQDMLDQVDYISTVSGGGFAGGAYISALYDYARSNTGHPFQLREYLNKGIEEGLTYSYTGALVRANFNLALFFSTIDDGDALEKAVDNKVLGYKRRKKELPYGEQVPSILLKDLFISVHDTLSPVNMPMLFTNSSVLSTMTIFPFTPDILERYYINGYSHRMKKVREEYLDPFSVPLAVGIKASGSFPVLISNTTLRSYYNSERPYLHLIDGAMTDNNGYYTAFSVLKQERTPQKMLFIVDADATGNRYTFTKREKAIFSLKVYGRLATSGIEARKAVLEQEVRENCARFDIDPFFFSFNTLIKGNTATFPEKINRAEEFERLTQLLEKNIESISDRDMQILYELVTNIGTKYTMTKAEQRLLFLTGRKVVLMQKKAILKSLRKI